MTGSNQHSDPRVNVILDALMEHDAEYGHDDAAIEALQSLVEQKETLERLARWAFDYIGIDWEQSYDDEPPAVTEARRLLTTGSAQTTAAVANSEYPNPASEPEASDGDL